MQTVVSMPVARAQPVQQVMQQPVQSPVQSMPVSEAKPVIQSVPQPPVKPVENQKTSPKVEHTESLKKSNFSTESDVCLYEAYNG